MMNRRQLVLFTLIVVLAGALVAAVVRPTAAPESGSLMAAIDEQANQNSITVTGIGTISVKPDMAVLTVGVQTQQAKAQAAHQENAAQMDALTKALKEAGIAEADMRTSGYSIYESYEYRNNSQTVTGYVVNNSMTINIRDITKVSAILDLAASSGANRINGLSFTVSGESQYYREALKAAAQNAKDKGETLAAAGGVSIGRVLRMSEVSYGGALAEKSYNEAARSVAMDSMVATPIETGSLEISASVTVTYAIP
jgi:uncharacterized protein YggE